MLSILRTGVVAALFFALSSLVFLVLKTYSFGRKPLFAEPRGSGRRGIFYAFGRGMMPWEKESVQKHLPTYVFGIVYHTGIFGAFLYLFFLVTSLELSRMPVLIFKLFFFLGFLSGLALFFKRLLLAPMKKISCLDDYLANILVDIFLLFAFAHTFSYRMTPFFFLAAILMLLYIPLGKIRHCVFFFYVRILFGLFYGRRKVFPAHSSRA